jgi:hypothetical protein
MRLLAAALSLVATALLTACGGEKRSTLTGHDLGMAEFKPIPEATAGVRFVGGSSPVRSREGSNLVNRYEERLILNNGALILYDRLHSRPIAGNLSYELWTDTTNSFAKNHEAAFDERAIKTSGDLAYILTSSDRFTCFFGRSHIGDPAARPASTVTMQNGPREGLLTRVCYAASERTREALEAEMLGLLARARFADDASLRIAVALGPSPAVIGEAATVAAASAGTDADHAARLAAATRLVAMLKVTPETIEAAVARLPSAEQSGVRTALAAMGSDWLPRVVAETYAEVYSLSEIEAMIHPPKSGLGKEIIAKSQTYQATLSKTITKELAVDAQ